MNLTSIHLAIDDAFTNANQYIANAKDQATADATATTLEAKANIAHFQLQGQATFDGITQNTEIISESLSGSLAQAQSATADLIAALPGIKSAMEVQLAARKEKYLDLWTNDARSLLTQVNLINDPVHPTLKQAILSELGDFWEITKAGIQGAADYVNGIQDAVVGLLNTPADLIEMASLGYIKIPRIPSPDWSRDLITSESDSVHFWAKLSGRVVGELGMIIISGAIIEKLKLIKCDSFLGRFLKIGCFTGDTQVVTGIDPATGHYTTTRIDQLKVGDYVLSRSELDPTAPLEMRQITAVDVHHVDDIRILQIQAPDGHVETIKTTDVHPFYVSGLGWVDAGSLQPGAILTMPDGSTATLVSTTLEEHPEGTAVYNLTVDGGHTYFVTDDSGDAEPIWVHNAGGPCATANRASGLAAQSKFARLAAASKVLQKAGFKVIGQSVWVLTPQGWREIDVVVSDGARLFGLEIKSGGAVRNALQLAKDASINAGGLTFGGRVARALDIAGQTIVATMEFRVP